MNEELTDNLMPIDGGLFNVDQPEEVKVEVDKEKVMIQTGLPILEEIFIWLDDEIKDTSNIDSIDLNGDIKAEVLAQRMLKDRLVAVKNRFEILNEKFNS